MPKWLEKFLGNLYTRLPPGTRPFFKSVFVWGQLRLQALTSGRKVVKAQRVEFLNFEIAHLERYEFISPARGEVQVEVVCSTVSPGTEKAVLCGLPGSRRPFPYAPGYSSAGRVVRVGRGVTAFKAGDLVCGRVKHSSADSVNADFLFPVPEGVSFEAASFIELGIITMQGMRKARISPGDTVAVLGQGLIGQLANRIARSLGAGKVIALAPSRNRAGPALLPGGADAFVETRGDFKPEQVDADIVIEAVGTPAANVTAMLCARTGGRVVLLGSSRGLSRDLDFGVLAQDRSLEIVGAHITDMPANEASPGRFTYRQEGLLFLELLRSGRLSVHDLVTWRPAPDQCNAVYETLAKGGREHVAITFQWSAEGQASRVRAAGNPVATAQIAGSFSTN